jgi:hypothetical protein
MSGHHDTTTFIFALVQARLDGFQGMAAYEEAERKDGGPHWASRLMIRAYKVGEMLKPYHDAGKTTKEKLLLRRVVRQLIQDEYGADVCPEHMGMLPDEVREFCKPLRKNSTLSDRLACWYETAQKWILKTGCQICPLQSWL